MRIKGACRPPEHGLRRSVASEVVEAYVLGDGSLVVGLVIAMPRFAYSSTVLE